MKPFNPVATQMCRCEEQPMTSTLESASPVLDGLGLATPAHLVRGRRLPIEDATHFSVRNPYDDSLVARVPDGGVPEIRAAVDAAADCQPTWELAPPAEKQRLFLAAADLVDRRRPELVRLLAAETGASAAFSNVQVDWSVEVLRLAAGWVYQPQGEVLRTNHPHTLTSSRRRPLGVVAAFTPWNGALVLAWRSVVLPLAAGNTVVVKPSELAPLSSGLVVGEILTEAGFPDGAVNVVTHGPGGAPAVTDVLVEDPRVRCLNVTGSADTGRLLAARAGGTLTRAVLELGGYNQVLVLDDADPIQAAKLIAFSAFLHQGQICMNARRALVPRPMVDVLAEAVGQIASGLPQGDPADPTTLVGPLIDDRAVAAARGSVDSALAAGASLVAGGSVEGRVMAPTVLTGVPDDHPLSHEEVFAPILVVRGVDTPDEALDLVEANPYGLSCSILTGETGRGTALAERIRCGAVHVNAPTVNDEPHLPFGGVKQSGWGRSGQHGLEDFTETVWTTTELGERSLPL
jgi:acyl-CoA reductase-like NAD-dependent aldehyde dehydrogenase